MNEKTPDPDEAVDASTPTDVSPEALPDASDKTSSTAGTKAPEANAGGRGLAWLALLLALPGAAFVVFWLLQQPGQDADSRDLTAEVERHVEAAMAAPQQRLDNQAAVLADLERQQQTIGENLDTIQRELGEVSEALEGFQRSLNEVESLAADRETALGDTRAEFDQLAESLERRMSAFAEQAGEQQEFDRELARRLQLMEAAALLQMGQHRFELAEDLAAARRAFRAADGLIQGLDEPRLAAVRRQLLAELEALDSYQQPDWLALSARLGRVANQVDGWPLRPALAEAAGVAPAETSADEGRMDELRRHFRQLVQVRPREGLPVDESRVQWVREQVRLRLATIEWGLARQDWRIVDGQLTPLASLVDEWFEPGSPAVADFHAALNELQQQSRSEAPPALGSALSSLRDLLDRS